MTDGLASLVIAGLAFCGSHVVLSSTRLRGSLRDQLGENGFLAVYSLTAVVTGAWFLVAYSHASTVPLWPKHTWTALVPVVVMPLATVLLIAGFTTPNPTTVGMERSVRADDPAPGVLRVTRHPVMWAIGLWAISHAIANGDLRSLIFFGGLGGLALGGTVLIDRKKRLALGSDWSRLAALTSNLPFLAVVSGRSRLRWRDISLLRLIAGLLLYAVLYRAHGVITGTPVIIP
ncbi:MAG: NnrU protein [Alphaproteobacteria bacterium]|nr:NnrU protein [Alphaproteobacteria bacterium]